MISNTASHKTGVERVTIPINGLSTRDGSARAIEQMILQVNGVRRAYISSTTEMAYVEYDPSRCTPDALAAAIDQGGFPAGRPMVR